MLAQFIINGLIEGSLYALMAFGFGLVYHSTRIFHIAHGAIYTSSAYFLYLFFIIMHIHLVLSIILSLICTCFIGLAIQMFVYNPVLKKQPNLLILFISSLGAYIILINLIVLLFGNETKILLTDIEPIIQLGDLIIIRIQLVQFTVSLIIILTAIVVLKNNRFGYLIQALADDQQLLSVLGINIKNMRLLVIAIGSVFAGCAALLKSLDVGMDPYIGMDMLLTSAVAVIIGGVGNYVGAVFSAVALGILQSLIVWQTSAHWEIAITFVVLLLILFIRPYGLFSPKRRAEEI